MPREPLPPIGKISFFVHSLPATSTPVARWDRGEVFIRADGKLEVRKFDGTVLSISETPLEIGKRYYVDVRRYDILTMPD